MHNGDASALPTEDDGAPISSSEGVDIECSVFVLLPITSEPSTTDAQNECVCTRDAASTTDVQNECVCTRDAAGSSSAPVVQTVSLQPRSVDVASLPPPPAPTTTTDTEGDSLCSRSGSMQSNSEIVLPPAITAEPRLGVGMPHSCTTPIGSTAAAAVTPEDLVLQLESLGRGAFHLHKCMMFGLNLQFINVFSLTSSFMFQVVCMYQHGGGSVLGPVHTFFLQSCMFLCAGNIAGSMPLIGSEARRVGEARARIIELRAEEVTTHLVFIACSLTT